MRWKKYEPGDRVFFECRDGSIDSKIVLEVEEKEYISDEGYPVRYQWLTTGEHYGIENYNCLPQNSPKLKELKKKFAFYDKHKFSMISYIEKILSPLSKELKYELLEEVRAKIEREHDRAKQ